MRLLPLLGSLALAASSVHAAEDKLDSVPAEGGRTLRLVDAEDRIDPARPDAFEQRHLAVDLQERAPGSWWGAAGWISPLPSDAEPPTWRSRPTLLGRGLHFRAEWPISTCRDGRPLSTFRVRPGSQGRARIALCGERVEALPWEGQTAFWRAWRVAQADALLVEAAPRLPGLQVGAAGSVSWQGEAVAGACLLVAPDCAPDRHAAVCPLHGGRALAVVAPVGDDAPVAVVLDLPDPTPDAGALGAMCADPRVRLPGVSLGVVPRARTPRPSSPLGEPLEAPPQEPTGL